VERGDGDVARLIHSPPGATSTFVTVARGPGVAYSNAVLVRQGNSMRHLVSLLLAGAIALAGLPAAHAADAAPATAPPPRSCFKPRTSTAR
jgi:hypothetical protein